jgi:beta-lactamase class A
MRILPAILACSLLHASEPVSELLEKKCLARIQTADAALDGVLGVAAIDLHSGRLLSYNGNTVFPQASSIKIPIMLKVFRAAQQGRLELSRAVTLTQADSVGGSGHLQESLRRGPLDLTVEDLVKAMIETSDNTATNKLIALVGGVDSVNRALDEMGFRQTRLHRVMMDSGAARRDEENVSTPVEMARLVELIYRGKAVDEAASSRMVEILKLVTADFRKTLPAAVPVASKPGGIPGVRCETGIVYLGKRPFVLSVMSTFLAGDSNPVGEVAGILYRHFEKLGRSNRYGHAVE